MSQGYRVNSEVKPKPERRRFSAEYKRRILATRIAPAQTRTVLTGLLPARDKSGEYWECGNGCGQTRLRPLRAPAG